MILIKKIKVYWIFSLSIGMIFSFFQGFSQCGIKNLPSKLVYIGQDNVDNNQGTKNIIDLRIPLPITFVSEDSLKLINWELSEELLNHLDKAELKDNNRIVLLLNVLNKVSNIELKGKCGIKITDQFIIPIKLLPAVHPRNALTSNSDSINDIWDIINLEKFTESLPQVKIFDRWGKKVYEATDGYRNFISKFDGMDKETMKYLPTGTYIYSIIPDPDYPEIIGELTLIR